MKQNNETHTNEKLTVAKNLHFLKVDQSKWIGWNAYYPVIFIFNHTAKKILTDISKKIPPKPQEGLTEFINELKTSGFLFQNKQDHSKKNFKQMVQERLNLQENTAQTFYNQKLDYDSLTLVNDRCNLACSYCVRDRENKPTTPTTKKTKKNIDQIYNCVQQFMARKIEKGQKETIIAFNGGEILMEWPTIKTIVEKITQDYPNIKIHYNMNTNLTIMTKEIAQFLQHHNFKLSISIDGYKAAHNRTRTYHNGKPSFHHILNNLKMYNEYNPQTPIQRFQGTIEHPEQFQAGHVYRMNRHGFASARLAPNLLDVDNQDAIKKAKVMAKFLKLNPKNSFKVTDGLFREFKKRVNQNRFQFSFRCKGLGCLPRFGVELNISTMQLSLLCGFMGPAKRSLKQLNNDIYSPLLWEAARDVIHERMNRVFNDCSSCELVAICAGGCILSGLDGENKTNQPGCTYQKEMWKLYLKKLYQDEKTGNTQEVKVA